MKKRVFIGMGILLVILIISIILYPKKSNDLYANKNAKNVSKDAKKDLERDVEIDDKNQKTTNDDIDMEDGEKEENVNMEVTNDDEIKDEAKDERKTNSKSKNKSYKNNESQNEIDEAVNKMLNKNKNKNSTKKIDNSIQKNKNKDNNKDKNKNKKIKNKKQENKKKMSTEDRLGQFDEEKMLRDEGINIEKPVVTVADTPDSQKIVIEQKNGNKNISMGKSKTIKKSKKGKKGKKEKEPHTNGVHEVTDEEAAAHFGMTMEEYYNQTELERFGTIEGSTADEKPSGISIGLDFD